MLDKLNQTYTSDNVPLTQAQNEVYQPTRSGLQAIQEEIIQHPTGSTSTIPNNVHSKIQETKPDRQASTEDPGNDKASFLEKKYGIGEIINLRNLNITTYINNKKTKNDQAQTITTIMCNLHKDPAFKCPDNTKCPEGDQVNDSTVNIPTLTTKACNKKEYKNGLEMVANVLQCYPPEMCQGLGGLIIQKDFQEGGQKSPTVGFYNPPSNVLVIDQSQNLAGFTKTLHHELSHFMHFKSAVSYGDIEAKFKKDYNLWRLMQSPDLYCDVANVMTYKQVMDSKLKQWLDKRPFLGVWIGIQQQNGIFNSQTVREAIIDYGNTMIEFGHATKEDVSKILQEYDSDITPTRQQYETSVSRIDQDQDGRRDSTAHNYGGTAIREDIATMSQELISNTGSLHEILTRAKTNVALRHKIEVMTGCRLTDDPTDPTKLSFGSQFSTEDRKMLGMDEKGAFYHEWSGGKMDLKYRQNLESGKRNRY